VVFKTTAIDHSAIPPAFASVQHCACFGEAGSAYPGLAPTTPRSVLRLPLTVWGSLLYAVPQIV